MSKKLAVWFSEVDKHDIALVGGKGANLGEMTEALFPVPFGYIVTSAAYYYFIDYNNLKNRIHKTLLHVNYEDPRELSQAAKHVRELIIKSDIPKDLAKIIVDYYHELNEKEAAHYKIKGNASITHLKAAFSPPLVAVRSSATAEDLPDASFAGQQDTYLNIKGENQLLHKVREAWASLFTDRATYYRAHNGYDHMKVGLASVVQRMVQSDVSGIAFSIDPVTNDKSTITIEAIFGLGEYIVQGKVTPDHYEVSKQDYKITKKEVNLQTIKFIKKGTSNKEIKLASSVGKKQKLADAKIVELAKLVHKIEKHYYFPQDIEWAQDQDRLYIVQSRPVTTIKKDEGKDTVETSQTPLLTGAPASPGVGSGPPVFVKDPSEIEKVKTGMVLVARQTNPDYVPAMKKAVAIVTEIGGRTSHAAIVSRELGIPAVVGAESASSVLQHKQMITVDGSTGNIYDGKLQTSEATKIYKHSTAKTVTKVYVNLGQTELAKEIAAEHVDGVGLMRAEFIMGDIGVHPKKIIKQGKQDEFITKLAHKLIQVAKPFAPRPVIYRATDFKTNEYHNLKGGDEFENKEENPMLGFRGAIRYIVWKDVFAMELEAIKKVRHAGYKNLHLMIPFVRTPDQLKQVRDQVEESGLISEHSFKFWMMVEIPSNVILLEDFIKVGIDGISIGTNDLTMLLMGVDRDNPEVASVYDERSPAVSWALRRIIRIAKKHGVTVSICGQAPSDYPEVVELLVNEGVTSISVNPDSIGNVRDQIYMHEKLQWQKSKK